MAAKRRKRLRRSDAISESPPIVIGSPMQAGRILTRLAEEPNEFFTVFDDVTCENLARGIASQDAVLLGRRT
jgi:hypothetical protein